MVSSKALRTARFETRFLSYCYKYELAKTGFMSVHRAMSYPPPHGSVAQLANDAQVAVVEQEWPFWSCS